MAYDPTKSRITNYDVTWNAADLGGVDEVKPNLALVFTLIKIGSAGIMMLDKRFEAMGDDAAVSVIVREVTLARIRTLHPWDNGSGAVDLVPAVGTGLYQYAQALTCHPRDKGGVTDEDLLLYKTVPISSFQLPRDGKGPDLWEVIFQVFPDQSKLNSGINAYGELKGA